MLTGMLVGAAAASLVLLGWAAGQLRWLAAHCSKQIAYWREEAERGSAELMRGTPQAKGRSLFTYVMPRESGWVSDAKEDVPLWHTDIGKGHHG